MSQRTSLYRVGLTFTVNYTALISKIWEDGNIFFLLLYSDHFGSLWQMWCVWPKGINPKSECFRTLCPRWVIASA